MKICYFGIFRPEFGRNRIYIDGLRQNGAEVMICADQSSGLKKYFRLIAKHRDLRNKYDVMIVGYPGYSVVWLARLLTRKPVVYDALCTKYEAQVLSRGIYPLFSFRRLLTWIQDRISVFLADMVLVETPAQKEHFEEKFKPRNPEKIKVLLTGALDSVFRPMPDASKHEKFTVLFRGRFLAEAGLPYIIEAAKILEGKGVDFLIIGSGHVEKEVQEALERHNPGNVRIEDRHLEDAELSRTMSECHVALGQFARHDRLERTIPHKAFESMAMEIPYVTSRAGGHAGYLVDRENCLLVDQADSHDLAEKIMLLKNDPVLADKIAAGGYDTYVRTACPRKLGQTLLRYVTGQTA